jgi:hypothetical protein
VLRETRESVGERERIESQEEREKGRVRYRK